MIEQPQTVTTGIKGADDFLSEARELGLNTEVKIVRHSPTLYHDGTVMLPANLSVCVTVTIPVPEELNGTALGLIERCVTLTSYWNKRDVPRSRGRWTLGNYSFLGGHDDLHVLWKVNQRLTIMAESLKRLRKLVHN